MIVDSKPMVLAPYPTHASYPSRGHFNSESMSSKAELLDDPRNITRTPSPTPSEFNALNGIKEQKTTKQKIQYYGIIAVVLTLVILFSVYHEKLITALKPVTDWLHDTKFAFLIPIALLIVVSFPPLFGHELISMLVGVAYDLPEAFVIVAVGTLLGEIANYFTFKYACTARGEKMEAKDISYGLLAHIVRHGGFLMVLVIRFSAIPPHFATAVFSTVGISFGVFIGAALLSLPKALVPAYIGYSLKPENAGNSSSNLVEKLVLGVSIVVTIGAYVWINRKLKAARPDFIYQRRKARQAKMSDPHFIGLPNMA
ncbi:hypothetical protein C8R44DRAFT_878008 [Mycena epipterygia]|nr:hypothetical protein C8R44DRAFT_878008 [Mycena epipterygia]